MSRHEQNARSLHLRRAACGLVAVAWIGGFASFAGSEPDGTLFIVVAASTVLAGLLIGRRWILLVPTAAAVFYAGWALLAPADGSELTHAGQVLLCVIAGILLVGLLELGITLRRLGAVFVRSARAA